MLIQYTHLSSINLSAESAMQLYIHKGLENEKIPENVTVAVTVLVLLPLLALT